MRDTGRNFVYATPVVRFSRCLQLREGFTPTIDPLILILHRLDKLTLMRQRRRVNTYRPSNTKTGQEYEMLTLLVLNPTSQRLEVKINAKRNSCGRLYGAASNF
jgi:hypothetical protein